MFALAYLFIGLLVAAVYLQLLQRDVDKNTETSEQAQEILDEWWMLLVILPLLWPWFIYYEIKVKLMSAEELERLRGE